MWSLLSQIDWHYNEVYQCNTVSLQEQHVQTDTFSAETERENGFRGKIGHTDASQENEKEPVFSPKDAPCASINFNGNMYTLILNHPRYTELKQHILHGAAEDLAQLPSITSESQQRMGELRTRPCWSTKRAGAAKR